MVLMQVVFLSCEVTWVELLNSKSDPHLHALLISGVFILSPFSFDLHKALDVVEVFHAQVIKGHKLVVWLTTLKHIS